MTRRFCTVLVIIAATLLSGATGVHGQTAKAIMNLLNPSKSPTPPPKPQGAAGQLPWIRQQVADSKALIEKYRTTEFGAQILAAGLPATTQDDLMDDLHEALHSYEASVDTLTGVINSEQALSSVTPQPEIPVPDSQDEASDLRTGISKASAALENTLADQSLLESLVAQAVSSADNAQQEYDRALERKQNATEDQEKSKAAIRLTVAEWQLNAANAQLYLYRWRVYWDELTATELRNYIAACRTAISTSHFELSLDKPDIPDRIAALKTERDALAPVIKAAIEQRTKLEATFQQAAAARSALPPGPDGSSPGTDPQATALDQQLQVARDVSNMSADLVDGLQVLSSLYGTEIKWWQAIHTLQTDHRIEILQRAREEAEKVMEIFAKANPVIQQKLQTVRDRQDRLKATMAGLSSKDGSLKALCQTGMKVAAQRIENLNETLEELDTLQDISSKVFARTSTMLQQESWRMRFRARMTDLHAALSDGWHYPIITIGDKNVITVASVVKGCVGLILALLLARFLSGVAGHIALSRFKAGLGRAAFIEKAVNYILSIVLVLCVLGWLNIPLTLFAFLGGALAIGVGFGAQNLVNNFISGVILLLEHHIKVGDLVVVDGNQGSVTHLGARFSSIRKADGVELLVPNSYLLEKTVINWTLSDPKHRYDFTVGVAYGTDTEFAIRVFKKALDEQPGVLSDPGPKVYFEQFGDSALIFRLYYWLAVDNADTLQVGSDIRLRIDRDCRAAKIEIAYPQLDVHLHAAKPLGLQIERKPADPA